MYQFSQRFKITTLILMGLGLLGLGYGFMSAPSTIEEAKAIMAVSAFEQTPIAVGDKHLVPTEEPLYAGHSQLETPNGKNFHWP